MNERDAKRFVLNKFNLNENECCLRYCGTDINRFRVPDQFPFIMLNRNSYLKVSESEFRNIIPNYNYCQSFSINKDVLNMFVRYDNSHESYNRSSDLFFNKYELEHKNLFNPDNQENALEYLYTAIALRRGQQKFRRELLAAYANKCAVTGCDSEEALEAAHICPYNGNQTNYTENGLLLRADIHTLFDQKKLIIDSNNRILLHPSLRKGHYKNLHKKSLNLPEAPEHRPNSIALSKHRELADF